MHRRHPTEVMPARVAEAVRSERFWFVIGGHAVRCFCPYRPSQDVDFGVSRAKALADLVRILRERGTFELLERERDTVHGRFDGIDVSIFVLRKLAPFTEDQTLTLTALLATKLHAILDRGTRRDFFDLYVLLEQHQLGLIACLNALREVYRDEDVNDGLVLRALSYFDDAEHEARLPHEDARDFDRVKAFFRAGVSALVVPPLQPLAIARRVVDVRAERKKTHRPSRPRRPKRTVKATRKRIQRP